MSKKQTVIITGALSGIGEECARTFSQVGYNVVFSGRNEQRGRELETELRQINPETHFFLSDIVFENQVSELIKYTQQVFGTIDVLLNVAGTEGNLFRMTKPQSKTSAMYLIPMCWELSL